MKEHVAAIRCDANLEVMPLVPYYLLFFSLAQVQAWHMHDKGVQMKKF
jgi:hypothetical protein